MESDEQLVTGFHHNTVLSLAPEIIEAVKKGRLSVSLSSQVVMHRKGGEYYRELATSLPPETVILTTSCGKFRFNDVDYGVVPVQRFRVTLI